MIVEIGKPVVIKEFWVVGESCLIINAVTTRRVFAGFLKVEDGTDVSSNDR